MIEAARPFEAAFVASGLPADFLARFTSARNALEGVLGGRATLVGTHVGARTGLQVQIRRGRAPSQRSRFSSPRYVVLRETEVRCDANWPAMGLLCGWEGCGDLVHARDCGGRCWPMGQMAGYAGLSNSRETCGTALEYIQEWTLEDPMNWRAHISIDAERMHGTPCLRGTRVPVYVILDNLAAGETVDTILAEYPTVRPEHIPAALAFAAELAHERVVPIPA